MVSPLVFYPTKYLWWDFRSTIPLSSLCGFSHRGRFWARLTFATSTLLLTLAFLKYPLVSLGLDDDNSTCDRILYESGRWLDPANDTLTAEAHFQHWQPSTCSMHTYDWAQASKCLSGKNILFIGDSTIRNVYASLYKLANDENDDRFSMTSRSDVFEGGIKGDFVWDV